jgi:hypothetical protein
LQLFLVVVLVSLLASAAIANGFSAVVQRQTNDRDHDLVDSLVLLQRHQDAIDLCAAELKRAVPRSDKAAKWAIRFSKVLTSQLESTGQFTEQSIAKAEQPVTELLDAYSNHPRKLFLQACLAHIQAAAAKHAVVVHSVSPNSDAQLESVFSQLSRSTRRFEELVLATDEERSKLDSGAGLAEEKSLSADLHRLSNELQVEIVSLALLQTDVFPAESRDQLAAANKALQKADDFNPKAPLDWQLDGFVSKHFCEVVTWSWLKRASVNWLRNWTDQYQTVCSRCESVSISRRAIFPTRKSVCELGTEPISANRPVPSKWI